MVNSIFGIRRSFFENLTLKGPTHRPTGGIAQGRIFLGGEQDAHEVGEASTWHEEGFEQLFVFVFFFSDEAQSPSKKLA